MEAGQCARCGEIVETSDQHKHKCKTTFEIVSLKPADYCTKFGHRWQTTGEVPNSRKRFSRVERVWESEDAHVKYCRYQIIRQCLICKTTQTFDKENWLG